jgi:two-component system chemotaxis response regulator CheY
MAQILVVDDSSTVRAEVGDFLKKNGLDVALAVDGRDGLVKLKGDPSIKLVVSDVNMPNMDGLTMAEKIRGELGNAAVNIIMLTTDHERTRQGRRHQGLDRQAVQGRRRAGDVQETGRRLNSESEAESRAVEPLCVLTFLDIPGANRNSFFRYTCATVTQ